jgi:Xaa-Pro aminopeptidase
MEMMPSPRIPFDWEERKKWLELPMPAAEFEGRVARLQAAMAKKKLDALVVYGGLGDQHNVRYLTNFKTWWGDAIVVVPARGEPTLLTNSIFHGEPMHSNVQTIWLRDLRITPHPHSTKDPKNIADMAADVLKEKGVTTGAVGLVGHQTIPAYLDRQFAQRLSAATVTPATHLLKALRKNKSAEEVKILREAGRIATAGFMAALDAVRVGVTEAELAAAAAAACLAEGAEDINYGMMCSAGSRSCLKNVYPLRKPLREGELFVIDVGIKYHGYQTDISRNKVAGEPSAELRRMLDCCLEQHLTVIDKIGPGVPIFELQKVMYGIAEKWKLLEYDYTTHAFGHGYGLDIVEEPYLYWGNTQPLEVGMTFYVEPMIIKHGLGTVCLEDMVVVTENGCEQMTSLSRKTW